MKVAEEETQQDVRIYIGLSTEGLAEDGGSYLARDDYSPQLVRYVKSFNDRRIDRFPWDEIGSLIEPGSIGGLDGANHARRP